MGSGPSTLTDCAFPYATLPGSAINCTATYAQYLYPACDLLQGFLGFYAIMTFCILVYRIARLRQYAASQRKSLREMHSFDFMCISLVIASFMGLESVDLYGFHAWYPIQAYNILDEFAAASSITAAIMLIDFWCAMASPLKRDGGLNPKVKYPLACLTFVNYVGLQIVGTSNPPYFYLFESLKSFGGSAILASFVVVGYRRVRQISSILKGTNSSTPQTGTQDVAPTHTVTDATKRAIRTLEWKFRNFVVIVILAAVALFVNAIISMGLTDDQGCCGVANWEWKLPVSGQLDPIQIVLKVIYIGVMTLTLTMFRVPKHKGSSGSKHGESTGNTPQGAGTTTLHSPRQTFEGTTTTHVVAGAGGTITSTSQVAPSVYISGSFTD